MLTPILNSVLSASVYEVFDYNQQKWINETWFIFAF